MYYEMRNLPLTIIMYLLIFPLHIHIVLCTLLFNIKTTIAKCLDHRH